MKVPRPFDDSFRLPLSHSHLAECRGAELARPLTPPNRLGESNSVDGAFSTIAAV